MKNIHLIPTDKPSRLRIGSNFNFVLGLTQSTIVSKNDSYTNQHIYITADEVIKEGDWFIQTTYEGIFKCSDAKIEYIYFDGDSYEPIKYCKKIILTTDQDLINDGVQAIDDEFLEWFVKNPSCEEVEVTYDKDVFPYGVETAKGYGWYKIIIPQEEPEQETTLEKAAEKYVEDFDLSFYDTVEEIPVKEIAKKDFIAGAKWKEERMYSEEDLRNAYRWGTSVNHGIKEHFNELFEQFKKK
jgi:hypothetical protein